MYDLTFAGIPLTFFVASSGFVWLCGRLREARCPQRRAGHEPALSAGRIVTVALLVYLLAALLKPEKFG